MRTKRKLSQYSPYSLKLSEEMRKKLEVFAERNEMQVSDVIRLAVRRLLEDKEFKIQ